MYIMRVTLCLFSALSRGLGALQISIIIIISLYVTNTVVMGGKSKQWLWDIENWFVCFLRPAQPWLLNEGKCCGRKSGRSLYYEREERAHGMSVVVAV